MSMQQTNSAALVSLGDEAKVVLRPSGTEPKAKAYLAARMRLLRGLLGMGTRLVVSPLLVHVLLVVLFAVRQRSNQQRILARPALQLQRRL